MSIIVVLACFADLLYLNPFWSLFARIPFVFYGVAAIVGGLAGWVWANRVSAGRPVTAVFAGLAVSVAAVAVVIAWVPRLDPVSYTHLTLPTILLV